MVEDFDTKVEIIILKAKLRKKKKEILQLKEEISEVNKELEILVR